MRGLAGRWVGKLRSSRIVPAHLALGRQGERIAAKYLRKNGYRVLYKNFRSKRGGEIDLVCRDCRAAALVFVEVKTRTSDAFGPPHHSVTMRQQDRIIRGAKEWLRMLSDPRISYRFDVVEVLMKTRSRRYPHPRRVPGRR